MKVDLITGARISRQRFGDITTICGSCKQIMTFKCLDINKKTNPYGYNFTVKCDCGMTIYKYSLADKYFDKDYYMRIFISKTKYLKNFKDLNAMEQAGMVKKVLNNGKRRIYTKK